MFNDFFNLIFPKTCFACHTALLKYEKIICTSCQFYLPKTNFHLESNNNLNKVFWGRVDVKKAASFYYFNKGGKVQNLLHELKYKGAKEVGERIGELYGLELLNTDFLKGIDLIIPVPLHVKKLKKRGYNQSECFAIGLSKVTLISVQNNVLYRHEFSDTQTKKSRFNRWQNVSNIFNLKNSEKIKGMHILLVDDVITTGSTIEACAQVFNNYGCMVSVLSIAYS